MSLVVKPEKSFDSSVHKAAKTQETLSA